MPCTLQGRPSSKVQARKTDRLSERAGNEEAPPDRVVTERSEDLDQREYTLSENGEDGERMERPGMGIVLTYLRWASI